MHEIGWNINMNVNMSLFLLATFPINVLSSCRFLKVACTCTRDPCIHRRAAVSQIKHVSQPQLPFHPYQTCNANVGDPEWSGCSGKKGGPLEDAFGASRQDWH